LLIDIAINTNLPMALCENGGAFGKMSDKPTDGM
jgi:hypothetical protein